MLKEFKEFINRGNVMDLAVAFVIAVAFASVVTAFVQLLLLPVIGVIFGSPGFSKLDFTINHVGIGLGAFLGDVVSFLLLAFGVFLVVKAVNRMRGPTDETPAGPTEIELLTEIRDALRTR